MAGIKMTYFGLKGRGEAIRLLCLDNNIPLEETVVTAETWPDIKKTMLFGQIPFAVMEDGTEMVQSYAILRALARKHGLYGDSDKETNRIDMINGGQEDLRVKYYNMVYTNHEEGKPVYIKALPHELGIFEKILSENNGGKGFFVGKRISWVDYVMLDCLDMQVKLDPECLNKLPLLKAFKERIESRPAIKARRSLESYKKMTFCGNGKE